MTDLCLARPELAEGLRDCLGLDAPTQQVVEGLRSCWGRPLASRLCGFDLFTCQLFENGWWDGAKKYPGNALPLSKMQAQTA